MSNRYSCRNTLFSSMFAVVSLMFSAMGCGLAAEESGEAQQIDESSESLNVPKGIYIVNGGQPQSWKFSFYAGPEATRVTFEGELVSSANPVTFVAERLEPGDILENTATGKLHYLIATSTSSDSFTVTYPTNESICFKPVDPNVTVYVGINKTVVVPPFDLVTLQPCGGAGLVDTGTTGPVYFVAPNGSDSNSNVQARNQNTPWRTISKAASVLSPGDTVKVRAGTYREKVAPANSGNATAGYITFMAYPGETPIIDSVGTFSPNPGYDAPFRVNNRSYIKFIGFRIPSSDGFGVLVQASDHIEIRNNTISQTRHSGISTPDSTYIVIDGNDVGYANTSMNQESISLPSTTNFEVSNNKVHHGFKEGIDAKESSSYGKIFSNEVYAMARVGIYLDGYGATQSNIDIFNNIVRDANPNSSGAGEDGIRVGNERGGSENNIRIYGNIVFNARRSGIAIDSWTSNASVPTFSNIAIVNNTTYGNGIAVGNPSGFGIRVSTPINLTGLVVRNNIAVGNKSNGISPLPTGQSVGNNFVAGDPQFVSSATRDFRLRLGSPAINTGTPISWLTTDFAGVTRGQGAGYEIGAYEFVP